MNDMFVMTIVVIIYLAMNAFLGYYGYRKTVSASDYLVAGRDTHPFVMALSYGSTFISTSAIVGFGGVAAQLGMGLLWLAFLNILIGIIIAFLVFGKRTRTIGHNLDAHTFPELLGKRFQSTFIQGFSGLAIFLFMPLYAAAVLIGAARFIETTFPKRIDFDTALMIYSLIIVAYVFFGGIKAVMYTDALQGGIMLVGMTFLLVWTYIKLGGVVTSHQALTNMASLVPADLVKQGHRGWTAMPAWGSPIWWKMVSTIIAGVGIGVLAQPQLAVRFMTVKSGRQINRAVGVGGVFILAMAGFIYVVGALTNVYFMQNPAFHKLAIQVAPKGNVDAIIPIYINSAMPKWFIYVFMLTLLSAAMSTSSAQFHAIGTSIGRDVFERVILGGRHMRHTIAITRGGIVIGVIVTVILGFRLPGSIIAIATSIFFGLCASSFLPTYAGALFWRGMTRSGAVASMVVGFFGTCLYYLFIHAKESAALGACKVVFGRDALLPYPWTVVDPVFVILPLSCVIAVVASLASSRPGDGHLDLCFRHVKKSQ